MALQHLGIWVFYAQGFNQSKVVIIFKPGIRAHIPVLGPGDMDRIFCKMVSHHHFIYLLILKNKLQKENAKNNLFVQIFPPYPFRY
jgi:hypothetical protein